METIFLALRVLLSLAVVLAAIWYAHRRLTRSGRMTPRAAKTVNVVTKQSIGAKASVVVMDVDGQRFLLGVTEQSVTVLSSNPTPAPEQTPAVEPAREIAPAAVAGQAAVLPAATATGSRPSGGAAFARVLSDLQAEPADVAQPAPIAYLPEPSGGALDGSILSAATWKRTAAVLRRAR